MRDPGKQRLHEGTIQHHGRFAFLLAEEPGQEDLMLRGPSLGLAMDGDRVLARMVPGDKGRPVGEIVRVVKRARSSVTGVLVKKGAIWLAVPEEADERDAIRVLGFAAGISPRVGEIVVVKITQWPTLREVCGGQVCESLGRPGEAGVRLRAVLRTRDLPEHFPERVLAESRAFPEAVSPEMWAGRLDLRALPLCTIDGADAKDFDDAVSLEVLDSGAMRLGVHIADVSHYVKKGTLLDEEAAERATSVYMADRVVPMLPPNLSDGLCSLMPNVERLTLSCFMDVDAAGKVLSSTLSESVIRSRRRFTYEEVESVLRGESVANVDADLQETILRMGRLFKALTLLRLKRGALDMTMPEYKVSVDAQGRPVEVVKRQRLDSHRLIEEFMLLANETVASALLKRRIPFLSRIHPDPDPRKLEILRAELRKMGAYAPPSLTSSPSAGMQDVLAKAAGQPLEETINMLVMRSLKQASYSHVPGEHFGLASEAYCHFTSPIRRYPDLVTHRAVKALLRERPDEASSEGLKELGAHCSERERVAADAERRSVDILRAELLKKKIGEIFEGVVSGSAAFGLFVTLQDLGASGLVRGASAALGSRVKVRLDRVDEGKGELDLSLSGPAPAVAAPSPRPALERKPKFGPRAKRAFGDNPRFNREDKPKWDPNRPKFDPNKPKWDSNKPRFDPRAKRKFDPNPKRKFDPNPKRKFDGPAVDPNKRKFFSGLISKKPRRR